MLDIKTLEAAFAKIGQIGKGEVDVVVDGVRVWMRVLQPEEDIEVQKYARGDAEGGIENLLLVERYKRATIAYAVVQVGDVDLRGVATIPTGEVLDNGTPVRVPKHVAVRRIVDGWTRQATTLLFHRYAELVKRIEDEANAKVSFDKSNVDAEIERIESRLVELRKIKAGTAPPSGITTEIIRKVDEEARGIAVMPPGRDSDARPSALSEPTPTPEPTPAPRPAETRTRVGPAAAPPPPRPAPTPEPDPVDTLPNVMHSFGDATEESVAAEAARIMAARAKASAARTEVSDAPSPVPVRAGRVPPHMAAARTAAEVAPPDPLASAEVVDPVGDVPAYRMPSVNVTDRGRGSPPPPPVAGGRNLGQRVAPSAVNRTPPGTPNNPNFRGGGGR